MLCFNAHDDPVDFTVPGPDYGAEWSVALDCSTPTGAADGMYTAGVTVPVPARCLLVLRRTA
jgi:isoamylase